MMTVVAATNNKHKLKEITAILGGFFNVTSLKDLGLDIDVEETGETFYDNALLKAKAVSEQSGMPAIADDSGLMVDALNGIPGVKSARYAGEPCDDKKNNEKLLAALQSIENRAAKFVSAIVLYFPDKTTYYAEGEARGVILREERGQGGFGYDPLFLSSELNKTFAEASADEKNAISHRARALHALCKIYATEAIKVK